jgi:hypothetical protein
VQHSLLPRYKTVTICAGALSGFNASDVAYVFFLACEVGGAKFIGLSLLHALIESNPSHAFNTIN